MTRVIYKLDNHWKELEVDEVMILGKPLNPIYVKEMHPAQTSILELSKKEDITKMTLREIGKQSGVGEYPQRVKHHVEQLKKKGLL